MNNTGVFDHNNAATSFDYGAEAELFPARGGMSRRAIVRYQRYVRAADAIRFAVEELPAQLLAGTYLEVDEARFDSRAIRGLYDSVGYPFVRRAAA